MKILLEISSIYLNWMNHAQQETAQTNQENKYLLDDFNIFLGWPNPVRPSTCLHERKTLPSDPSSVKVGVTWWIIRTFRIPPSQRGISLAFRASPAFSFHTYKCRCTFCVGRVTDSARLSFHGDCKRRYLAD